MQQRTLGSRTVGAIGLGGMPMSIEGRPAAERSIAAIHAAIDSGVTLIDTANAYHRDANEVGHNEELIAEAIASYPGDSSDVIVATKGGHLRPGDGTWTLNGHPEYLKAAAKESARRLGVDSIGLYYYHRPDPSVPYADSVGAIRDLLDEGVIQQAGVSNANIDQIVLSNDILGGRLAAVQNQFSPAFRSSLGELELCATLGIAFLPWSPLGGISKASELGSRALFQQVADSHDVSPQQIALAWELALAPVVIPIPGSSRPESILDSVKAAELTLSATEIELLSSSTA
jgi:aryl-alcohol dehydrogenase-like predicted oxidoreductase